MKSQRSPEYVAATLTSTLDRLDAVWARKAGSLLFFAGVDMANDNTVHGSDNIPLAEILFENLSGIFSAEE